MCCILAALLLDYSRGTSTVHVIKNMTVTENRQRRVNDYPITINVINCSVTRGIRYNLRRMCRLRCELFGDRFQDGFDGILQVVNYSTLL